MMLLKGQDRGEIHFNSGKVVYITPDEVKDLEHYANMGVK